MPVERMGRIAPTPPPPFSKSTGEPFVGAYPFNAPREAIGRERPLTRDELRQVQGVLSKIDHLPYFLSSLFTSRYDYIRRNKSPVHGLYFLKSTFLRRLWPRIEQVNQRSEMNTDASLLFLTERENYARLPGMNDKELKKFAGRIAAQLFIMYEELSDAWAEAHGGKDSLFTDEAQAHLYGQVAGAARTFNINPLNWKKYRKGQMTIRQAFSGVGRLINDEWWINQFKAQRMRWHESLLIAAGEVNKDRSPYASKNAIRDVHSRRLANLEYLKSCELENKITGERIDLISKVMGSISNPEIRRMELMNTIAGIERYAASEGDVGMFITLTAPSKYHPTRQVGKGKEKTVQLNHGWNDEAYTPKDTQRYLCRIWSLMRTAFKDNDLQVYGMRVVEPHHDGTPHWHMMLFCKPGQRKQITEIMRRYALKEDGDERGAAKQRFQAKHLNQGGAAGYIAKYIAKNIDGYALDGQLDHDTGKPLQDTAAAVTAWASTWRIPQFKPIGLPTMGAYRELRKLPRGVSIASEFDDRVEAARAAADEGEFDLYIAAQGGANVPRDSQTVRVARTASEETNDYEEDIIRVVGIYAPHMGSGNIHVTRSADWRIVPKVLAVEPLTLKSGIAAPRSPVNNCGKLTGGGDPVMIPTPSEQAAAVLNLIERGVIGWNEPDVVKVLNGALKVGAPRKNRQQRSNASLKTSEQALSARMTKHERERVAKIRFDLVQEGITPRRWELEALVRGATMIYGNKKFAYPVVDEWGWYIVEDS
ncbi:replication endonuclease [Klebsiella quasipneumoniae]|uniref:replication endonuclease n=1 Tax=Klebsiella quasipneumoniae TaxID=1463165 RepID=UPI001E3E3F39|nr:replication endonuclease [Klebsiella quasipneumoniae]MCC5461595.1 replication endonuclease [Klebsiella quasipneumoniae subsp. similipneumoniae]MCS5814896.1 replication endonuclease [Klebsiella pneumoniae subsp. pneumoniae]HBW8811456.1 replication endonuclease [Klebsiella pneumoniae]HCT7016056.1 replication endonuclease [Klebsiella pneumoniae]